MGSSRSLLGGSGGGSAKASLSLRRRSWSSKEVAHHRTRLRARLPLARPLVYAAWKPSAFLIFSSCRRNSRCGFSLLIIQVSVFGAIADAAPDARKVGRVSGRSDS